MKTIRIKLEVDGEEVWRYYSAEKVNDWNEVVADMLETIEKSNEQKF